MKLLIIILSIFIFSDLNAQTGSITGKIINSGDKNPLPGGTISLFSSPDSALVKVEISDHDGVFLFNNILAGEYFLEVTSVGFVDRRIPNLSVKSGEATNAGETELTLSSQTLEGVVIAARKPMVQYKADKLIFNVESSVGSESKSALEILEKAPGITVDKDGNISMKGRSGVKVMIDDRPTYLSPAELANYLKSLPAASLDQLEIMANPSAKYDAAGNSGIINIKTKKMQRAGINGNISSSLRYTDKLSGRGNAGFNYRHGKVNLFGNYSYSNSNSTGRQPINRFFKDEETGEVQSIFEQMTTNPERDINNNAKIGADFYTSDHTIVGVILSGYNNTDNTVIASHSVIKNGIGMTDSSLSARNNLWSSMRNRSVNASLRHTFDSAGKKITADFDYITYNMPQTSLVATDFYTADGKIQKPSALLKGNMPSSLTILSGKVDFTLPLNKIGQIETGLKASNVETDNLTDYENIMAGKPEPDFGKSNHFLYRENIFAGYISWSRQLGSLSLQTGLRAENTHTYGHQLGNSLNPDSSFKRNYMNLFPTAYISFNANDKNTLGLNFGRRILRPNYSSLNPFIYFIDEYTYQIGNVYLKPQFTNQIELSHDFKGLIHSAVNYSHTGGAISQVLLQDADKGVIYQTDDNIATENKLSFSTGVNFRTAGMLATGLDVSVNYSKYEGQLPTEYLDKTNWAYRAKFSEQLTLGRSWTTELSWLYISPQIIGQFEINRLWKADFSVQKNVLDNKGVLSFSVNDIFNTWNFSGGTSNRIVDIVTSNIRTSRNFNVGFRYSFGNPIKGLKQYRSGGAGDEQSRVGK